MKIRAALGACAIFALLAGHRVAAQSSDPQTAAASSSRSTTNTADTTKATQQTQAAADQSDQPVSVAEAARLARANKGTGAKAAKNYDDDNFPRSTPIVKKNTTDSAASNASVEGMPPEAQGKVVLLDFWASWCGPCRMALPKVKELQSIYGGEDFTVVSVSEDDDVSKWHTFVANEGMSWPQRFDGSSTLLKQYQVRGLPTYVLLDRDGKEVQRYEGEDPGQSILERAGPQIKQALQSKP
jgi:thiol-disulfide isomerase/thioredoxin